MTKNTHGNKKKNDVIFILSLLSAATVLCACFFLFAGEGDTVVVTLDGEIYGEYSLGTDRSVDIRTDGSLNTFVISGGKVYMEHASCPDGICTAHRPIYRDGESIICLPNKVVITVASKNETSPDIVA